MKKITLLCMALFAVFAVVSCDKFKSATEAISGVIKMDTKECIEKVSEIVQENVNTNDWKIVKISISEDCSTDGKLENKFSSISVDLVDKNGEAYTQSYIYNPSVISDLSTASTTFYKADPKDIEPIDVKKALDPERVLKVINDAKSMIPQEYEFLALESYEITNTNKDCTEEFTFAVVDKDKNKRYVSNAGKKSLVYYELNFKVNNDGKLTCTDLEE